MGEFVQFYLPIALITSDLLIIGPINLPLFHIDIVVGGILKKLSQYILRIAANPEIRGPFSISILMDNSCQY